MGRRTNTAQWLEKYNRWQINVQKDGQRRTFTSSAPGRTGQREANAWLDNGVSGSQRVDALWALYLADTKASTSLSNSSKIQSIGENYILPAIGQLRIDRLTKAHLQGIVNQAYKTGSLKKERRQTWRRYLEDGETLSRKTRSSILATIKSFIKYCRVMCRATTLNPETLKIPEGARYKGRSILQPDALAVLFQEDFTVYRGKRVFDRWVYAYRFAVSVGTRPGETVGLWYGDIRNDTVQIRRSINVFGEETRGKNENAVRGFSLPPLALQAVERQKECGVELQYNTPFFRLPASTHIMPPGSAIARPIISAR